MQVFKLKKIISALKLLSVILITLVACGCATLTYSGSDFDAKNIETVKTQEDFVFSVFQKPQENYNIKIGISKTPIVEILAIYVQVENLSYNVPYVFKVEDLHVKNPDSEVHFITTQNYLNIWQTQEANSMSALSAMGNTFQTMSGMQANYNDYNQTMVQNASEQTSRSAFSRLDTIGNQISKHSIKFSSTISPRKSQYFYFFIQDTDKFPLTITYKDLKWEFSL